MAVPNSFPLQATAFIGREPQLRAVCAQLLRPDVRLLTLTGPGGTGKTRLALQAATDLLESFPDGVFFIPLAPVTDPDLVPSAMARGLDLRASTGRSVMVTLRDFLRPKELLLLLDNFEQVAAAASVVTELIGAAPGLKVMVTSRAVLHLYGEHEFPVPSMALPDRRAAPTAAYLASFEATHLFMDRARAARPDLAVDDESAAAVAEICHRLDGLPLAIELAAARIRVLPPRAMLQRMERTLPLLIGGAHDLPTRQQTLWNTIAWSYNLLEPSEQILFRRLAVFRGCTLEAAEAVCVGEPAQPGARSVALVPLEQDILSGLQSLVEKSLLRREELPDGQPRYEMLETVREFALERLDEDAEASAVRRRQVLNALDFAERADIALHGPQQAAWFARLEQEHDNLRAALGWSERQGYAEPAFRLAGALWWFWSTHGHVSEGRERLSSLLLRFPLRSATEARAAQRAEALYAAGVLAATQNDQAASRALHEEGLALRRMLGDWAGLVTALQGIGTACSLQGDYAAARRYLEESVAIARKLGNPPRLAAALHDLGNAVYEEADVQLARTYVEESVDLLRQADEPWQLGSAIICLAIFAQDEGLVDEAHARASEALALYGQAGDRRSVALALAHLGGIALAHGDETVARQRLGESIAIQQELGDAAGITFVLERFAGLAAAQGNQAAALRLAGAAAALREEAGVPLWPSGRVRLDRTLEPARRALGEAAAAAAWQAGSALARPEAIAEALTITDLALASGAGANQSVGAARTVLTSREQQVAALIARGYTNRQIAAELVITEGTAASHVVHILNKLGYDSRSQVAAWVVEQRLALGVASEA
jgi:predicted ATPase/DNA-binding CsgD family transcriptional regulator